MQNFTTSAEIPVQTSFGLACVCLFDVNDKETILQLAQEDALAEGEAPVQILEGCYYEYSIGGKGIESQCLQLRLANGQGNRILTQSRLSKSTGRIEPNIFVGTLKFEIINQGEEVCGRLELEVRSEKLHYRQHYRTMLEDIAGKCTDLIMQHSSPAVQNFEANDDLDAQTAYQRFAFVQSLLETEEFRDSLHRIINQPVTRWKTEEHDRDVRASGRLTGQNLRQMASSGNRVELSTHHPLRGTMRSVPAKLKNHRKTESVDTPENRFVKHVLNSFLDFLLEIQDILPNDNRAIQNVARLSNQVEEDLSISFFSDIGNLQSIPLNSPALQRKSGYREILKAWLMFQVAAKLAWKGGNDVYEAGKRDVATLYEYWLFFQLLEIVKDVFQIDPRSIDQLIEATQDGLGLQLRQGKHIPVAGVYEKGARQINVQFSYNRAFSGKNEYPKGGAWTKSMRPDYTLSLWPKGLSQDQAEIQELIVHVHFDAKYKVDRKSDLFDDEAGETEEEIQQQANDEKRSIYLGTFKRIDLLKMHAYKDAIRRTSGAYILYPGEDKAYKRIGFHEIIPGLGAFAISPRNAEEGAKAVKDFLVEVREHFMDLNSQRERLAAKTHRIFETAAPKNQKLTLSLPEEFGVDRTSPDETFVLIGYYRKENWDWIVKNRLYNTRAGNEKSPLKLGPQEVGAKYVLLYNNDELVTSRIYRIKETGPRIFSKKTLIERNYQNPSQDYYLIYSIEELPDSQLKKHKWDLSKLANFMTNKQNYMPFTVSLSELMRASI